jgi:hypothetical protein
VEQPTPRRRISSAINKMRIALYILHRRLTRRRWFIEYNDTDDRWQLITD